MDRLQILELETITEHQVLIRPATVPGIKISKIKGDSLSPRLWSEDSHTYLCPYTVSLSEGAAVSSKVLGDCILSSFCDDGGKDYSLWI